MAEITQLYNTVCSTPAWEFQRDMFVFACLTGIRFGDWSHKFTVDNDMIKVSTQKTGEVVYIPLHPAARDILNRYKGMDIRMPTNQEANRNIKKLCQLGQINQDVTYMSSKGGGSKLITCPKWQLITTHTARRSFATNAFLSSVPVLSIMKITGHRTERSFMSYIRASSLENAIKLKSHPFFNT
jgi:integrase